MGEQSPVKADDLSDYDIYSRTPPRTKILRKNRERRHRTRNSVDMSSSSKVVKPNRANFNRRNTVSTMFEELVAKADDNPDSDYGGSTMKRTNKRSLKLLRGSERDLKLDIASAQAASERKCGYGPPQTPQPSYQIESSNRFLSLSNRTICLSKDVCRISKRDILSKSEEVDDIIINECPQSRVDFYNTFSMLIRMGCAGDKQIQERSHRRAMSQEERTWQNELKDLIWLELQAFHADRTPEEEDAYLCSARENIDPLLKEIMSYRFRRNSRCFSAQNSDSGVEDDCNGCVSIQCLSCIEAQNEAIKDIDDLMQRLEFAESLFPSTHAFAELYPLYSSPEFVGRVKAISLWYNMTRHQRLKLLIFAKLLALIDTGVHNPWPLREDDKNSIDSTSSPSDSNNSSGSSVVDFMNDSKVCLNFYNFAVVSMSTCCDDGKKNVSPYRRYIENMLKTRTLHKSLTFLDNLQHFVLRKVQLTLEKPETDDIFQSISCVDEDEELKRFGSWSPEAKDLCLPSYRASFLYLAAIPLGIIFEFLKMRLEQKPENPSPLSVRQLMRELKDGLKVATEQREKIGSYVKCAVIGTNETTDSFKERIKEYDACMLMVFKDYLDYLQQWALLQHETFQKNLLEEEWHFSMKIIGKIPGGAEILTEKFSYILCCILKTVSKRLRERIEEVLGSVPKDDNNVMKQVLFAICREMQSIFNEEREMSIKTMAFCKIVLKHKMPDESVRCLKEAGISLKCSIPETIGRIQTEFDQIPLDGFDDIEKSSIISRIREILMQGYRFGFEFYKEMTSNVSHENEKLTRSMIHFANLWMRFVTERCERGRGMRPRWAYHGLEFLQTVCEPRSTKHLTDDEFEELKRNMDVCISHVIGTTAPSTPESGFYTASPRSSLEHIRARSRGSSPSPRPTYKSQRSCGRKTSAEQKSPISDNLDSPIFIKRDDVSVKIVLPPHTHPERCLEAVDQLDSYLDGKLRKHRLIGKVISKNNENKPHIRRRYVTFTWQRGIKIGQGRFGKVYTAVNNNTGEMMAVKEIALQPNDTLAIKRVADEMKILEGIAHVNLVRYYGVEVHKEEMLIFMEFCAEGTLENLVLASENGLSELLVRRYTYQLVSGVAVLHEHGIVHRDIKPANIFLTEGGNCLKIGDFGCATKIKSNSTMPGELQGFVGTQAYMAPEVFTRNMSEGHGRGADIWSVGCVVVEMASGKRPWSQYDSNYQIMFKVGMGESPDPPDNMTDEGLDFLVMCFHHNPRDRATAHELLDHNFVKIGEDFI